MASISRLIALLGILVSFGLAQQQSLVLNAAPPGGFISVTGQAQAPFGASSPCYWVIAKFPVGNGPPSAPACLPPTVGTQVLVSWNAVTGATAYDLLRTTSAVLPPAGIASMVAVATAIAGTTFTDTFGALLSYTVVTASAATATFLLDNQNQALPQVRLTIQNATGTTASFLLAGVPAQTVTGPGSSTNGLIATWVGTSGTQLGTGLITTTNCSGGGQVVLSGGAFNAPAGVVSQGCMPPVRLFTGTTRTLTNQSEIFICTAACTVTPISPGAGQAGQQLCVQNDDNVAAIITLAALPGVSYENTARTSYKAANTALASTGAVSDQICIVARDNTHYNVFSFVGTWN